MAVHPEVNMNVCTKFHGIPLNDCWDILLRNTNVNLMLAQVEKRLILWASWISGHAFGLKPKMSTCWYCKRLGSHQSHLDLSSGTTQFNETPFISCWDITQIQRGGTTYNLHLLSPCCYKQHSSWWSCISILFQETLEHFEECSGKAVSQSEISIPATYAPVLPPTSNRTERPIWSAPRRYPRSPSPLAQPLPHPLPGPPLRPVRSPAHSPGSSPRSFSPIRKVRPPVGIPTSHLPVEPEGPDPCDQTHCPSQQWQMLGCMCSFCDM